MIYKLVDGKFEMKNRDEDTKKEEEAAVGTVLSLIAI